MGSRIRFVLDLFVLDALVNIKQTGFFFPAILSLLGSFYGSKISKNIKLYLLCDSWIDYIFCTLSPLPCFATNRVGYLLLYIYIMHDLRTSRPLLILS